MKNISLDMFSLYCWLKEKFQAENIYIFTGYLEKYEYQYIQNKKIGYEYVFKEIMFNKDEGKIKANCDVDIAIQGIADIFECDLIEAVLISSDGDFLSLIKFWQKKNIKVRIISPADPNKCSYLLKKDNLPITYLRQILHIFANEKALDEDETS